MPIFLKHFVECGEFKTIPPFIVFNSQSIFCNDVLEYLTIQKFLGNLFFIIEFCDAEINFIGLYIVFDNYSNINSIYR